MERVVLRETGGPALDRTKLAVARVAFSVLLLSLLIFVTVPSSSSFFLSLSSLFSLLLSVFFFLFHFFFLLFLFVGAGTGVLQHLPLLLIRCGCCCQSGLYSNIENTTRKVL
jgi:hypothetical protein